MPQQRGFIHQIQKINIQEISEKNQKINKIIEIFEIVNFLITCVSHYMFDYLIYPVFRTTS